MEAVMMSIQPKWCELIASGKKTVEVRKTRPKLETPFKAYIYCTKGKEILAVSRYSDKSVFLWDKSDVDNYNSDMIRNGKIIGEFMCYDIGEYETEFYPPEKQPVYEAITEWNEENEVYEAVASNCDTYQTNFLKSTCMALEDFREYLGVGEIPFYGWHISNLVIYDEPKELSSFYRPCLYEDNDDISCFLCDKSGRRPDDANLDCFYFCEKPPQSWYYVEELR